MQELVHPEWLNNGTAGLEHRLQLSHNDLPFVGIENANSLIQFRIELGISMPGFIPRLARTVCQVEHLHAKRAGTPVGCREVVSCPTVPE